VNNSRVVKNVARMSLVRRFGKSRGPDQLVSVGVVTA